MIAKMLTQVFFLVIVLTSLTSADPGSRNRDRTGRLLSLFQIVQFPNDACSATNNKNGTCYTANECETRSGINSGTCASGYGVCCTFTVRCGGSTSENCTYFESAGTEIGACSVNICKCNSNVCQLRLDFNTFVLSQPNSATVTTTTVLNGVPAVGGTVQAGTATVCNTDLFSVSNPNGQSPPAICGTNTGEHLYVDANDACNALTMTLGTTAATTTTRSWSIKITQYSCDYPNLAPGGCDQWLFGATTNTVRSFNYNAGNGYHLANQDQNICVRRERGLCRICWSAVNAIDVMLSGNDAIAMGFFGTQCCGYGTTGKNTNGFDCVMIPSALNTMSTLLAGNAFCGRSVGLAASTGVISASVCSRSTPFNLRFLSDGFELVNELTTPDRGFQLAYIMDANNC